MEDISNIIRQLKGFYFKEIKTIDVNPDLFTSVVDVSSPFIQYSSDNTDQIKPEYRYEGVSIVSSNESNSNDYWEKLGDCWFHPKLDHVWDKESGIVYLK